MAQLWRGQVVSGAAIWAAQNGAGTGTTIVITGITPADTSIAVTWTGAATHYRINGGTATALPDGTSPDTLTGLTANTEYNTPGLELGASSSGPWSDPVTFGTLNPGEGGGGIPTELVVQDATHAHAADNVALTVSSTLAVQDATHAHTADNVTLTVGGTTLEVQDALHGHSADSPTLTVNYTDLVVQDALHAHSADNVTLTGDVEPPAPPPASGTGGRRRKRRNALMAFKPVKEEAPPQAPEPAAEPGQLIVVDPMPPRPPEALAPGLRMEPLQQPAPPTPKQPDPPAAPVAPPVAPAPPAPTPAPAPVTMGPEIAALEAALRERLASLDDTIERFAALSLRLQADHDRRVQQLTAAIGEVAREQKKLAIAIENQRRVAILMAELSDPV